MVFKGSMRDTGMIDTLHIFIYKGVTPSFYQPIFAQTAERWNYRVQWKSGGTP